MIGPNTGQRRIAERRARRDIMQHGHQGFSVSPRAVPHDSRNARTMSKNSGSSSRKASWPLSVSISAHETRPPPALSACPMARDSEGGNSQSDVNDTTQNRV